MWLAWAEEGCAGSVKGSSQSSRKARNFEWEQEPEWPRGSSSQELTNSISRHRHCNEGPPMGVPSWYYFPKIQILEINALWVNLDWPSKTEGRDT